MLIVLTYKLGESIVEFAEKCDNNNERVMGIKKLVNDYGYPIPFYCLGCNCLVSISKQDREDGMISLLFFVVKSVGYSRITFTFIF